MYVADYLNHAIRMLSGAWVARERQCGSADGVGTIASFAGPSAVAVDEVPHLLHSTSTAPAAAPSVLQPMVAVPDSAYDVHSAQRPTAGATGGD